MSPRIVAAILAKDVRSLLPLVLAIALLFAGDVLITRLEWLPGWSTFRYSVLVLAGVVLTLSVYQLDSPVSLTADWLCRPVPRAELLTAKVLLVFTATYVVRVIAMLAANLVLGLPLSESLLEAVLLQDRVLLVLVPTLLIAAAVTESLIQGFGTLIALFVCVFVIPTPFVQEPGPLDPDIGENLETAGLVWLALAPAKLVPLACAAVGVWLVYWRRRVRAARVVLVATAALTVLLMLLPTFLLPWDAVFAAQAAAVPRELATHDDALIRLRSTRACFTAARVGDFAADGAREYDGPRGWSERHLREAGPDTIVFDTSIEPYGLPAHSRLRLAHVQANYLAGGAPTDVRLRPARYFTEGAGGSSLSHAWALPGSALRKLGSRLDLSLELRYSLALLEPTEFEVPTDGKRHALPGLGYCGATLDEAANGIVVDCFTAFSRPGQISAELQRIPATRVYGPVDFAPAWLRWPQGTRTKLVIGSPRLGDHRAVHVTYWRVTSWLNESLTLPGLLGDDLETCPLPARGGDPFQQTRWRDSAPHEASSVSVDDGVQLEVLDFGGTGTAMLLLPGLGATAHAYDDLAPRLARAHRVVALTRRGSGSSSRPDYGYDTPRLARDILRVMDAMKLQKVVLVGHSVAGDELTWLGGHHPERFSGLVYLDAAYDRARGADGETPESARLRELRRVFPPEPPYPPRAFTDYEAAKQMMTERGHTIYPEGELIAFYRANQPHAAGTPNVDHRALQAIVAAIGSPDYRAVKVPALAIYATGAEESAFSSWYDRDDARLKAAIVERTRIRAGMQRENIERFQREVARGKVVLLPDSRHYVFLFQPGEVLEEIGKFVAALEK
jgi:non-heme chloroperoxidase